VLKSGFIYAQNQDIAGGILDKPHVEQSAQELFEQTLDVLTIGLDGFTTDLANQQVAGGDPELADLLSKLGS